MHVLTEVQTRILEALAHYKFLTHSQLELLGVGEYSFLCRSTKLLRQETPPLIRAYKYLIMRQQGRVEYVFSLTAAGAATVADILRIDPSELGHLASSRGFQRDYWHRKYTIDFQIWLVQALEDIAQLEIRSIDRYFNMTGANHRGSKKGDPLRASTRVDFGKGGYCIPDVNFVLSRTDDHSKCGLFSLEMTNGMDTKRVLQKIRLHCSVLESGALSHKYGLTGQDYNALFLFSEPGLLESVRRRLSEITEMNAFQKNFYFGALDTVKKDVLRGWQKAPADEHGWCNFVTGQKVDG